MSLSFSDIININNLSDRLNIRKEKGADACLALDTTKKLSRKSG